MSSKQVRDILDQVRKFHHRLHDLYQNLEASAENERVLLLLDHMGRHEENINRCLMKYETKAADGILDTWLRFISEGPVDEVFRSVAPQPDMSVEDVIECSLRFDAVLVELYRQLATATAAPRVEEMFTSLLQMETEKAQRFAKDVLDMDGA